MYLESLCKEPLERCVCPHGVFLFQAKEYDESFRCYSLAIALDDANAKLYNNRAAAAHKLQRFEQAEDDCTR